MEVDIGIKWSRLDFAIGKPTDGAHTVCGAHFEISYK